MSGPRYYVGPRWWPEVEASRARVPPCRSMSVVAPDSFLFGIFLLIPIIIFASLEIKESRSLGDQGVLEALEVKDKPWSPRSLEGKSLFKLL